MASKIHFGDLLEAKLKRTPQGPFWEAIWESEFNPNPAKKTLHLISKSVLAWLGNYVIPLWDFLLSSLGTKLISRKTQTWVPAETC